MRHRMFCENLLLKVLHGHTGKLLLDWLDLCQVTKDPLLAKVWADSQFDDI